IGPCRINAARVVIGCRLTGPHATESVDRDVSGADGGQPLRKVGITEACPRMHRSEAAQPTHRLVCRWRSAGKQVGDDAPVDRHGVEIGYVNERQEGRLRHQAQAPRVALAQRDERRQEADEVSEGAWEQRERTGCVRHKAELTWKYLVVMVTRRR